VGQRVVTFGLEATGLEHAPKKMLSDVRRFYLSSPSGEGGLRDDVALVWSGEMRSSKK
jgi:hypothetical protein